jgi:hypothetical protein
MKYCTYHCRSCGSHFTSLEAFDSHRAHYECNWPELPDGYGFIEQIGECRIADDRVRPGAVIYSLVRPGKYGARSRQSAEGSARNAVLT